MIWTTAFEMDCGNKIELETSTPDYYNWIWILKDKPWNTTAVWCESLANSCKGITVTDLYIIKIYIVVFLKSEQRS